MGGGSINKLYSHRISTKNTNPQQVEEALSKLKDSIKEAGKFLDSQSKELIEVVKRNIDLSVYIKKKELNQEFAKRLLEYICKQQEWCAIHFAVATSNTIAVKYMLKM